MVSVSKQMKHQADAQAECVHVYGLQGETRCPSERQEANVRLRKVAFSQTAYKSAECRASGSIIVHHVQADANVDIFHGKFL